jgi:hypothetical protein
MGTTNTYEGILVASSSNNNVIAIAHTGTQGIITTNFGASGSNTPLVFGTNGAGQMTLSTSGNLGLGVTPNIWGGTNVKALEVYLGSMSASLTYGSAFTFNTFYDSVGNWKYLIDGGAGKYEIGGNEHIWSNAPSGSAGATATFTERMKINSSGNVLIGTTTDSGAKLLVNGSGGRIVRIDGPSNTDNYLSLHSGTIEMFIDADFTNSSGIVGTQSNHNLILRTNGTNKVWVTTAGNVGIDTNTPADKLEIKSGYLRMFDPSSGINAGYTIQWSSNNGGTNVTYAGIDGITTSAGNRTGDLRFLTSNAGAPSEKMRITSGGNVEIKSAGELRVYRSDNARYGTFYTDNSNVNIASSVDPISITSPERIVFNTASTQRMRIDSSGNVTFGVTAAYDTSLLWRADFTGGIHGRIYATGAPRVVVVAGESNGVQLTSGATSWTSNSDERLKDINFEIENAIEKLLTLRAVHFSWKADKLKKENLGLIAQDVEKQFPQLIDRGELAKTGDGEQKDKTQYLGIRYTELIPVLIKAIQELQAKLDKNNIN